MGMGGRGRCLVGQWRIERFSHDARARGRLEMDDVG